MRDGETLHINTDEKIEESQGEMVGGRKISVKRKSYYYVMNSIGAHGAAHRIFVKWAVFSAKQKMLTQRGNF